MSQSRQPKGVPVGGQFAEGAHDEAGSALAASAVAEAPDHGVYSSYTTDNARIEYEWIGEGNGGDFDPDDPSDEPRLRAVVKVSKWRLREDHPDFENADADGFVEVASWCTRESARDSKDDLSNLARHHAESLDALLLESPTGPRSEQTAAQYARHLAESKATEVERTALAMNPDFIAEKLLANGGRDIAGNHTSLYHYVRGAADRASESERQERIWDTAQGYPDHTTRALAMEAEVIAGAATKAHTEAIQKAAVADHAAGVDERDRALAETIVSRAARVGYREGQFASSMGYEQMADAAVASSNSDFEMRSLPDDRRAVIIDRATRAAIYGHSTAYSEMGVR